MNKDKTINTAIKMLTRLKSNAAQKGGRKQKKPKDTVFSFKKWLIILAVLFGLLTAAKIYYEIQQS